MCDPNLYLSEGSGQALLTEADARSEPLLKWRRGAGFASLTEAWRPLRTFTEVKVRSRLRSQMGGVWPEPLLKRRRGAGFAFKRVMLAPNLYLS